MHFITAFTALCSGLVWAASIGADTVPYNRLSKNDSILMIVDMQVGLQATVRDWEPTVFKNAVLAHAALGVLFDLPTILTTSVEAGPNGPLPKEILEMYPNTSVIRRPGEVNAWDNPDVRAAVKATGRRQVIIAGITTDVCVALLALSLRAEGYDVYVNLEASGAFSERIAQGALMRMQGAGVQIMNLFSISAELFRDWRSTGPDAGQVVRYVDHYIASESFVVRAHVAALSNGVILPGENATIALTSNDPDVFV